MAERSEMMRRQRVLADFGDFVLDHEDVDEVLTESCRLVADALDTHLAKVVEIKSDTDTGLVRAGVGWREGIVGRQRVDLGKRSSEAYAIEKAAPVITNDVAEEHRFEFPTFLRDHGVVALVNVPVFLPGRKPWGVLQVDATEPRAFDEEDVEFLKTYAMVLGPVIDRLQVASDRDQVRVGLADREKQLSRALETLRESETRHRLLIESWAQATWETDAAGAVVVDSPSWRAYTGQTEAERLGDGWLNAIHPDDRGYAERHWRESVAARQLVNAEFRLRAPNGGWRWTNVRAAPVLNEAGEIEKWAGINIDISDRKRAEAALRGREADLARVQRIGEVGGLDIDVADGLRSTRSPEYLRLHGLPPDTGQESHADWIARVHPEDRERAERVLFEAINGRSSSYDSEYRIVRPLDGAVRWIHARADIERDQAGNAVRLVGAHIDVTEQKRSTQALRASEERLRGVLDGMGEAFGIIGPDFTILEHNHEAVRIDGRPREAIVGRSHWDAFPGTEHSEVGRVLKQAMADRQPAILEHRYAWSVDHALWLELRVYPTSDGALAVFWRDITERKAAGEALRESEERQAFLLKLSDTLRAEKDEHRIEQVALELLAEQLSADRTYITHSDYSKGETVVPAEVQRVELPPLTGVFRHSDWPESARRVNEGTIVVRNAGDDPDLSEHNRASFATTRIGALIGVGLRRGSGDIFWTLAAAMAEPRGWTPDEVILLEEVAERTLSALQRARSGAALRESEERYRALFESMDEAYAVVDVLKDENGRWSDLRFVEVNPAFMTHTSMPWPVGQTATELLGAPNPRWTQLYGQALDSGEPIRVEEGEPTLGLVFDLNIFTLDRSRNRVAVLFTNITKRKRAEAALRESKQWLQTLMQGVPQLVWRAIDGGHWTWASPQWTEFTGQSEAESHGDGWLACVHPDDRQATRAAWAGATERGEFKADYRICHRPEGRYRWFQTRATPVRDELGAISEWLGTSTDVDDLRRAQQRQQVLLAELQHRVRNILAITRSIISRSNDGERSLDEYMHHLLGRIGALARTQVLLTRAVGEPVDLQDLIRDELLAQAASEDQFALEGEDVALSPKAAEVLTLAIHELATNATKYGALSRASGKINLRWKIECRDQHDWLVLEWKETGVPIVDAAPRRRGFGSELISRRIPYELRGHGSVELKPGGVESRIEFPLIEGESILQTDAGGR